MEENKTTELHGHSADTTKETAKSVVVKSLAIIGLVALLALGTWGTVQVIRTAPSFLSGLSAAVSSLSFEFFPAGTPSLNLTLQSYSIKSDEAFTLTWSEEEAPAGHRYAFVYECADELSFTTPNANGGTTRIACGELYTFESATRSLTLTPLSHMNRFLDVTIKLSIVTENQIVAEDEVMLTVVNERIESSTGSTPTPTPTPPTAGGSNTGGTGATSYYPVYTTITAPRTSDPNGYVDLSVEILETGVLESRGDRFVSTGRNLDQDERGGVRFVVRNLGTKTAEDWVFEAKLPTRPAFTYKSKSQPDLGPGDRIEFTLGFDRLTRSDDGKITVEVDPRDSLNESNRSNNQTSVTVNIND